MLINMFTLMSESGGFLFLPPTVGHQHISCRAVVGKFCFELGHSVWSWTFYSLGTFWQAHLWPWIILCSPLPPSCHNHTRLILSDLSFIPANQLPRCALFHHLLSRDSIIISLTLIPYFLLLPCISFLFFHLCPILLPPVAASGSTLTHPSARAQTNQSRVVLFRKDQKQLVSFHVYRFFLICLCCPICESCSPGTLNAYLTHSHLYLETIACLHDSVLISTQSMCCVSSMVAVK